MTEKQSTNRNKIYYWLGGVILVCLLAIGGQYLYWKYLSGDKNTQAQNYALVKPNKEALSAISDYVKWTDTIDRNKMSLDHQFTQTGLKKIANVLSLMAHTTPSAGGEVSAATEQIRITADSLTYNWKSGHHADMIKKSFELTVSVLKKLQNDGFQSVGPEMAVLTNKVDAIVVKTLTLDQRGEIKSAFRQTGIVFQKLTD